MDWHWTSWLPGVAAFVGLQVIAFTVSLLANSATPPAARLAQVLRTTWGDQRKELAIEKLARLMLAQREPHREVANMVIAATAIVCGIVGMVFLDVVALGPEKAPIFPLSFSLRERFGDGLDRGVAIAFAVMVAISLNLLSGASRLLISPNTQAAKILALLDRMGIPNAEAWESARARAIRRTFLPMRNHDWARWEGDDHGKALFDRDVTTPPVP